MTDARTAWTLIQQGRWADAEAAARRAGPDPDAVRALGQALQLQNRREEAEVVLRQALPGARPPHHGMLLRDLAQLVWMRTGDLAAALEPVDAALAAAPADPQLLQLRALLQQQAGDPAAAAATLDEGLKRVPGDILLLLTASHFAAERGAGEAAFAHAADALRRAPELRPVQAAYGVASLAAGRPEEAARTAARLLAGAPFDQMALGLQADAWRMLGDDRYRQLYDYGAFVRSYAIETPPGWPDLPAYLADLASALDRLHTAAAHPLQQSLRHGSQVQGLHGVDDPLVRAFFASAGRAVGRYLDEVGRGADPLRRRITGRARIASAWSVRLRPSGFHVSHFHPEGWLSSAFYVETPEAALGGAGREGWLKFGEPGVPTQPPLEAEHFVRPEPGLLVLFPSYMWHGTVPFHSDEKRMTIAFDVVPVQ